MIPRFTLSREGHEWDIKVNRNSIGFAAQACDLGIDSSGQWYAGTSQKMYGPFPSARKAAQAYMGGSWKIDPPTMQTTLIQK